MDGVHDLGGMQGFGPVEPEPDQPPFRAPWEGRVHGLMLSLAVGGNLGDGFRYAIERMDPVHYLTSSYYEHWLEAVIRMLGERGTVTAAEVDERATGLDADTGIPTRSDPDLAEAVRSVLRAFPVEHSDPVAPRYAEGGAVRVRTTAPAGHTRCPRYVRGARGRITHHRGTHLLHDSLVMRGERVAEPLYTVSFRAADLWADAGDHTVHVDLWESYLEEATR